MRAISVRGYQVLTQNSIKCHSAARAHGTAHRIPESPRPLPPDGRNLQAVLRGDRHASYFAGHPPPPPPPVVIIGELIDRGRTGRRNSYRRLKNQTFRQYVVARFTYRQRAQFRALVIGFPPEISSFGIPFGKREVTAITRGGHTTRRRRKEASIFLSSIILFR